MPRVLKPEELETPTPETPETLDVPPGWESGTYQMRLEDGSVSVDAILLHGVAVYLSVDRGDPDVPKWSVGSVSTGLRIVRVKTFIDAVRIGQLIDRRCRAVFLHKTKEKVIANTPTWLREWLEHCHTHRCYTNPEPFIHPPQTPATPPSVSKRPIRPRRTP